MNAIQLKQELIHQISIIEDIEFLKAIKTIIDYNKRPSYIELSEELESELLLASEEGKNGKVLSQSEMDKNVEQWLGAK